MRRAAQRWGAVGFRSPATQRRWEWMPQLGFGYDTSSPDTDPYEPQAGGCCTVFPFFNGDMVELPITLPQDHTLFVVLGQQDPTIWRDKVRHIRERGGMVLALTHPDYAGEPRAADAYQELLRSVHADPTVWHALPREVAAWWRRRATSSLESVHGGWVVTGPAAADGQVRFGPPSGEGTWAATGGRDSTPTHRREREMAHRTRATAKIRRNGNQVVPSGCAG